MSLTQIPLYLPITIQLLRCCSLQRGFYHSRPTLSSHRRLLPLSANSNSTTLRLPRQGSRRAPRHTCLTLRRASAPHPRPREEDKKSLGNDLLSQRAAPLVPSALAGLTAGFGMGPGVPPPLLSPRDFSSLYSFVSTEQVENSKFSTPRVKPSTVSTGQLNTLLCLHLPPIKPVFSRRSYLASHQWGISS